MATTNPPVGSSNVSSLSDWSGQYVTDMLGKAQAVADQPYQVYQGPMTAGESGLQSKVFQGLGGLNFPSNLGQSFSSPMGGQQPQYGGTSAAGGLPPGAMGMPAYGSPPSNVSDLMMGGLGDSASTADRPMGMPMEGSTASDSPYTAMQPQVFPQQGGTAQTGTSPQGGIAGLTPPQASQQPSNIAQSYMNPYLQSVLDPQMAELRRQNDITNMKANAGLTQAGAFGGGRQAIMNAENNRNLMMEQNKTVGQGYANAYDKAMGQFNTEQGQARDLANLMSTQGAQQRDIEQQGISADYNEFLAQRDYPMKQTQYLQSMLQGLPISTVSNQAAQQSGIGQLSSTVGGLGNIMESLKKLGL